MIPCRRRTQVPQLVACVRVVVWFLLSTWVQEKQRSDWAFAVHRWAGGLTALPWFRAGWFGFGQGFHPAGRVNGDL